MIFKKNIKEHTQKISVLYDLYVKILPNNGLNRAIAVIFVKEHPRKAFNELERTYEEFMKNKEKD